MKLIAIFCFAISINAHADFTGDTVPFSFVAGQVDGMKIINDLPKASSLAKIGVKKNDVVIDVDGNSIVNQQASKEAYEAKTIKTAVVLRDGRKVSLR